MVQQSANLNSGDFSPVNTPTTQTQAGALTEEKAEGKKENYYEQSRKPKRTENPGNIPR